MQAHQGSQRIEREKWDLGIAFSSMLFYRMWGNMLRGNPHCHPDTSLRGSLQTHAICSSGHHTEAVHEISRGV